MRFTKNENKLHPDSFYLLQAPSFCPSGYVVARYVGADEDGAPDFRCDATDHEIPAEDVEGWMELNND